MLWNVAASEIDGRVSCVRPTHNNSTRALLHVSTSSTPYILQINLSVDEQCFQREIPSQGQLDQCHDIFLPWPLNWDTLSHPVWHGTQVVWMQCKISAVSASSWLTLKEETSRSGSDDLLVVASMNPLLQLPLGALSGCAQSDGIKVVERDLLHFPQVPWS